MGKTSELMQLLKTGNSDSARKLISKMKKSGKRKQLIKELVVPDDSSHGQTVIHYCAAQNFVEFIHDLAEMGAPIDSTDEGGLTPLHLASGSGRTSAVSALLGRGADPNIASHNGDTPLHLACAGGHMQTVEALIAEQANSTMFNVSGQTPLDLACQHGHPNVVSILLRSGQFSQSYLQRSDMPHTALLLAAKSGHVEVIALLVKHGFDVNRKLPGANGNCLHEAALYGKVEAVKFLIQCGADVQSVNHQGLTALDIVNMYTDPRSAGLMKQVLQDSLAQQARVRIAQQAQPAQNQPYSGQGHNTQSHPSQGHHAQSHPSQGHYPQTNQIQPQQQQQQGRRVSQDSHYHQPQPYYQQPQRAQQAAASTQQPQRAQQAAASTQQPQRAQQAAASTQQPQRTQQAAASTQQPQRAQQAAAQIQQSQRAQQTAASTQQPPTPTHLPHQPSPTLGQQGFSYIMPGMIKTKQRSDTDPSARHHDQDIRERSGSVHRAHQQQAGHTHQQQAGHTHQQQVGHTQASNYSPQHQGHAHMQQGSHTHQAGSYSPQHQSHTQQQQAHAAYSQQRSQSTQGGYGQQRGQAQDPQQGSGSNRPPSLQSPPPSNLQYNQTSVATNQHQHGYQQSVQPHQGTPDTTHGAGGAPPANDLATMIAAKLASRKPMATSPTKKDFHPEEERFRTNTLTSSSSISEARQSSLKRRNSLKETTPEREYYDRSNPPTLPRRGPAGPPSFVPMPPADKATPFADREQIGTSHFKSHAQQDPIAPEIEKPKLRKVQPKPPPEEPSMDDELLKKLMRRQNKIQKAEIEGVESEEIVDLEQNKDTKPPSSSAPPPIPERKTPLMNAEVKEHTPPPPSVPTQPPPFVPTQPPPSVPTQPPPPAAEEPPKVKSKPRVKPPPPKPKKEEPEVPPWQVEILKRKERRAQESIEFAESMMVEKEAVEDKTEVIKPEDPSLTVPVKEPVPIPVKEPVPIPVKEPVPIPVKEPVPIPVKEPVPIPVVKKEPVPEKPVPPPPQEVQPLVNTETSPAAPPIVKPKMSPQLRPKSDPKLPDELKIKPPEILPPHPVQSSTPTSELSRSTSLSSLPTTMGSACYVTEPIRISNWLTSYKLSDYIPMFEASGYDTTDFLKGATTDEVTEIGVVKPGHRKKIMTALASVMHNEHLLMEKPDSICSWLSILGLMEYEQVLLDAGYDDIDFISDITTEELQDIGITKRGHLKRFMRGIAELMEVTKSAPPTPSLVAHTFHLNGNAPPPTFEKFDDPIPFEETKTPEPQDDEKTIIAPPSGFDEPDMKRNSRLSSSPRISVNLDPVTTQPKRQSRDETTLLTSDPSRPRAYSNEHQLEGNGSSINFSKMRYMLEQQMGISKSNDSLEISFESEASDQLVKPSSRSPSHSPKVARKLQKSGGGPPPAPRRAAQTQLSTSHQSLSSSTSSLSSTYSERMSGSYDVGAVKIPGDQSESPPKLPVKKRKSETSPKIQRATRVPVQADMTQYGGNEPSLLTAANKSYSVEDITAALDDMVQDDEFLKETDSVVLPGGSQDNQASMESVEVGTADDELDALTRALSGFPVGKASQDYDKGDDANQLLADIDDMLADLNSHLDLILPEEEGTAV